MISKLLMTILFCIFITSTFYSQPVSLNENSIKFENAVTAVLVGEDGLALRTEDGGNTWIHLNTGITNNLKSNTCYPKTDGKISYNVHLAVGENGVILRSINDGYSWKFSESGTLENLNDVFILNSSLVAVCGDNGTLLLSYNLGETWHRIATGTNENLNQVIFLEGANIYYTGDQAVPKLTGILIGDNGTVLRCLGLSGRWLPMESGTIERLNALCSPSMNDVIAGGNAGKIIKSTDRGLSWFPVNNPINENINEIKFFDDYTTGLASCDNGVILNTLDNGNTWNVISTPTTNDLKAIGFGSPELLATVGENGTELYSTDGGYSWESKESPGAGILLCGRNPISGFELKQNYPNPFNPTTSISYYLPFDAHVSIKIYDVSGKEITTLVNSVVSSGSHNVQFNASAMASGIYFYTLKAVEGKNEITKTMKMILTK